MASLKQGHREVVILRCDNAAKGKWVQHFQDEPIIGEATLDDSDGEGSDKMLTNNCMSCATSLASHLQMNHSLSGSRYGSMSITSSSPLNQNDSPDLAAANLKRQVARIFTSNFPQYFAVITRCRQDVVAVGSEATVITSSSVDNAKINIKAKYAGQTLSNFGSQSICSLVSGRFLKKFTSG